MSKRDAAGPSATGDPDVAGVDITAPVVGKEENHKRNKPEHSVPEEAMERSPEFAVPIMNAVRQKAARDQPKAELNKNASLMRRSRQRGRAPSFPKRIAGLISAYLRRSSILYLLRLLATMSSPF